MTVHDVITAKSFRLADGQGNLRAELSTIPGKGSDGGAPLFALFDDEGRDVMALTLNNGTDPVINLSHGSSLARIGLGATATSAGLSINDSEGRIGLKINVDDETGSKSIELWHGEGDGTRKALSLEATGEKTSRVQLFGPHGPASLTLESSATDPSITLRNAAGELIWKWEPSAGSSP